MHTKISREKVHRKNAQEKCSKNSAQKKCTKKVRRAANTGQPASCLRCFSIALYVTGSYDALYYIMVFI